MRRNLAVAALILLFSAAPPSFARPAGREPVVHHVRPGQILGGIAAKYGVSVAALCRANGIEAEKPIRPGQRLLVPAKERAASKTRPAPLPKAPPGASWGPYVQPARKRGYVTIAGHGRSWSGYVLGPEDEVLPLAKQRISWVLASWRTGNQVPVHERLIRLLARVSDTFGGRKLRVVSGYREKSYARHSKHKSGHALDFSVPGIPNEALRDYLRTLSNVGVGYYPNSTHIHLDVRDRPGYWVDYSRPGQKPRYPGRIARGKKASKSLPARSEDRKGEPVEAPSTARQRDDRKSRLEGSGHPLASTR